MFNIFKNSHKTDPWRDVHPWQCQSCGAVFLSTLGVDDRIGQIEAGVCAAQTKCQTAALVPMLESDKRKFMPNDR